MEEAVYSCVSNSCGIILRTSDWQNPCTKGSTYPPKLNGFQPRSTCLEMMMYISINRVPLLYAKALFLRDP